VSADNPLVSVVVPTYKQQAYIDACLEALTTQTHEALEILVVNDHSPDGTAEKLEAWRARDPRIEVLLNPSKGDAQAINFGIQRSRGRYIAVHASDDIYRPTFIARLLEALERAGAEAGLAYSQVECFDDTGRVSGTIGQDADPSLSATHPHTATLLVRGAIVPSPAMMLRREVYERLGLWSKEFPSCPDYELILRTSLYFRLVHVPEVLCRYRVHSGSTHAAHRKARRTEESELSLLEAFFSRRDLPGELVGLRERALARTYASAAVSYFENDYPSDARRCGALAIRLDPALAADPLLRRALRLSRLPEPVFRAARRALRVLKRTLDPSVDRS